MTAPLTSPSLNIATLGELHRRDDESPDVESVRAIRCLCVRRVTRSWYLPWKRKELEGRFLGHPSYLEPKGEGDRSMMGTRGTSRGDADEWDPQDPRRMAKARLLESQS